MKKLIQQKNIFMKFNAVLFIGLVLLFSNTENSSASNSADTISNQAFVKLNINEIEEDLPYSTMVEWFEFTPYLATNKLYNSEIENVNYCFNNDKNICALTRSTQDKYHTQKNVHSQISEEDISFYLAKLSQKVNKKPENAKITFNNETKKVELVSADIKGLELNIDQSTQAIINTLNSNKELPKSIDLSYEITKADIRSDNLTTLGIDELLGEGKSNFRGSTPTRIHNIKTAIGKFDGKLIKPGEEFSFVETLGPVDKETGYKEELVIKKDKTEKEFGGGICQVSTTTFRAAIYSGLTITARRNHAYPVHYYDPQGMDAAIYVPSPDLKFVNNTPGHILVQVEMNETTKDLSFKFYGTSDKRKVEVTGPFVTEKNDDGSMKTYFTQKVFDDTGKLVIDEVFKSAYASPDNYPKTEG